MFKPRLIMAIIAPALVVLAACGEDEEATPATGTPEAVTTGATPRATRSPSPRSTEAATEAAEAGGIEGFRAFAPQIQAAVQSADADFFLDRAEISTTTCPNEFEPRCDGQPEGATFDGIWLAYWRSEGSLLTVEQMRDELSGYLESLSTPELRALAFDSREGEGSHITGPTPVSYAVISGEGDPAETTRIIEFKFSEGEWRTRVLMVGGPLSEEDWLSGTCTDCYEEWERWEGS